MWLTTTLAFSLRSSWCAQIPSNLFSAAIPQRREKGCACEAEVGGHPGPDHGSGPVYYRHLLRRQTGGGRADDPDDPKTVWPIDGVPTSYTDNVVVKWDDELLQTIRANPAATGPTVTSRAIAVLHTAIYDAWAAYVPVADGVHYHGKATGPASGGQEEGDQLRGPRHPGLAVRGPSSQNRTTTTSCRWTSWNTA